MESPNPDKFTKISDLKPYLKNLNLIFMVLEKGSVTKTKDDKILTQFLIGDPSGCVTLSLWDSGEYIQPSDIIRLRGAFCTLFKHSLILYSNRFCIIEKIGEFNMLINENLHLSNVVWIQDPNNPNNLIYQKS
jgi:hypothetical protein